MYKFCGKGGIYQFCVEIGGICNMHHWLRGMDAPDCSSSFAKWSCSQQLHFARAVN